MITNDMTKQEQAAHECRPSAEQQQNRAAALWAGRGSKSTPRHGGCRKVLLQVILSVKGHRLHFLFKAHKRFSTLSGNNNENLMTTLSIFKWHAIERAERGSSRMPPSKTRNDFRARTRPMYACHGRRFVAYQSPRTR